MHRPSNCKSSCSHIDQVLGNSNCINEVRDCTNWIQTIDQVYIQNNSTDQVKNSNIDQMYTKHSVSICF